MMHSRTMKAIFVVIFTAAFLIGLNSEHVGAQEQDFEKTMAALQGSFGKAMGETKKLKDDNVALNTKVAELNKQMSALQKQLDSSKGLRNENDKLKSRLGTLKGVEGEKKKLETTVKMYAKRIQKMESERDSAVKESASYQKQITSATATISDNQKAIKDLTKLAEDEKSAYSNIAGELEKSREKAGKLHYNLGNMYFKAGDYEKAAYEYEHASQLLPMDPDVYYNLGVVYDYHLNDGKKAQEYYQKHLRLNPGSDMSLFVKERISESYLNRRMAR